MPSIYKVRREMEEMEEDPEDTIPLSQRTRVARVAVEEQRKGQSPPSPMTQDHLIQLDDQK